MVYSEDMKKWTQHSTSIGDGGVQSAHLDLDALGNPAKFFVRIRVETAE